MKIMNASGLSKEFKDAAFGVVGFGAALALGTHIALGHGHSDTAAFEALAGTIRDAGRENPVALVSLAVPGLHNLYEWARAKDKAAAKAKPGPKDKTIPDVEF